MTTAALVFGVAIAAATPLETAIRAVAALPGEPSMVGGAAVTREEASILTLENADAFDTASSKRRLLIVAGASGDAGAAAVLDAVRWFKTRASAATKGAWVVSALPAPAGAIEAAALVRWA